MRDLPVERITDVVGNLVYGTMFTNYFVGQAKPAEQQAQDILDIIFRGILTDRERARLGGGSSVVITHAASSSTGLTESPGH